MTATEEQKRQLAGLLMELGVAFYPTSQSKPVFKSGYVSKEQAEAMQEAQSNGEAAVEHLRAVVATASTAQTKEQLLIAMSELDEETRTRFWESCAPVALRGGFVEGSYLEQCNFDVETARKAISAAGGEEAASAFDSGCAEREAFLRRFAPALSADPATATPKALADEDTGVLNKLSEARLSPDFRSAVERLLEADALIPSGREDLRSRLDSTFALIKARFSGDDNK